MENGRIRRDKVVIILELLIARINRGNSLEQAIEQVSELNYPPLIKPGLDMTKSSIPLQLDQLKDFYVSFYPDDYFFLMLECLRVIRISSWEANQACDALIILKNWMAFNEYSSPTSTNESVFGFGQKRKPGALAQRAQEILFNKL
ncbi:hypothetical protein P4H66_06115 [Paenibacillus dokdonensis]|uniref:Uncharacterized protein n=1 Tax=Paenibacillus dokdonensis TaxID=2567944 RepID=A0ABU6GJ63_9BACL|nr:hypothetical protein [Paenibacillus dokdonensis]MEC0239429.1 hypothetical protein [Paenibacillus dokdonensis]